MNATEEQTKKKRGNRKTFPRNLSGWFVRDFDQAFRTGRTKTYLPPVTIPPIGTPYSFLKKSSSLYIVGDSKFVLLFAKDASTDTMPAIHQRLEFPR